MDGPRAAILVYLPDGHVRYYAGDGDVDARGLQWQDVDGGIAAVDEEVWRERLIGRRSILLRSDAGWHERGTGNDSGQDPMRSESHATE